jgi:predicted ATPase/signal transduction histidine kinase/DNA-binding response OmpR family regulator
MLVGRPPFPALDRAELVHHHLAVPVEPIAELPGTPMQVLARLLSKDPAGRYQTAFGLAIDLKACSEALRLGGKGELIRLGEADSRAVLRFPLRLQGRNAELAKLRELVRLESNEGRTSLCLVVGKSGTGKSSLIQECISQHPRHLPLAGKYDQIHSLPYQGITQALRGFVQHVLTLDEIQRKDFCDRLREKVGASLAVLVEFLPELGLLVGSPAPGESFDAGSRDQRFKIAVQGLFELIGTPSRPVVVFLDDLQWAEPATLLLLESVLLNSELRHTSIIVAFRGDEVQNRHPLALMLDRLKAHHVSLLKLDVAPLSSLDTQKIVASTLSLDTYQVSPLTELIYAKTQGNPFHIKQLLQALQSEGTLRFDGSVGSWTWDLEQIHARVVSADVASLMTETLDRLSEDSRDILSFAACFGSFFHQERLAQLDEHLPPRWRTALAEAVGAGLLLRATNAHEAGTISFSHDRVQKAAYERLTSAARLELHSIISAYLLEEAARHEDDDATFAALDQFRQVAQHVTDPTLGRRWAQLALEGARKAKFLAAYDLALLYLETVVAMPGEVSSAAWDIDADLAYQLNLELLEVRFLEGSFDSAMSTFDDLKRKVIDPRRRALVYQLLVSLHNFRSNFDEALVIGVEGLKLLGMDLTPPFGPKIGANLLKAHLQVLRQDVYDFSEHPKLTNPYVQQVVDMMLVVSTPAFLQNKDLFVLLSLKMFSLTLKHGLSDAGVASIGYFALVNYIGFGAVERPWRIVRNIIDLFSSVPVSDQVQGRLTFTYCMVLGWYKERHADLYQLLSAGLEHSWRALDLEYVGYYYFGKLKYTWVMGKSLETLEDQLAQASRHRLRLRHETLDALCDTYARVTTILNASLSAPTWGDEDEQLENRMRGEATVGAFYLAYMLTGLVLADLGLVARSYRKLLDYERFTSMAPDFADFHLFGVLLHCAPPELLPDDLRKKRRSRLKRHYTKLENLAEKYPTNHEPHFRLAQAAMVRLRRGTARAIPIFEQAIGCAEAQGTMHLAALGADYAARGCAEENLIGERDRFVRRAASYYDAWGAKRRTVSLSQSYGNLFPQDRSISAAPRAPALDLEALIRASHAVFDCLDYDALVKRLMTICIQNAGADYGHFFVSIDGRIHLAVTACIKDAIVAVSEVEGQPNIEDLDPRLYPTDIVAQVAALASPVELEKDSHSFSLSPYFSRRVPKSVLCFPSARLGQVDAVIYLENSQTVGVFTGERLAMLTTLASLAAVSLSNAKLYAQQQQALALEKRSSEELLRINNLKDAFLANTSHELKTPLHGIIGLADSMMNGSSGELPKTAITTLELICNSGRRLTNLVNDILDFSRLEQKELTLQLKPVGLRALVDVVFTLVTPRAKAFDVQLVNAVDSSLGAVLADENRLEQILLNLVDNAVKFSRGGRVRVLAAERDYRIHVTVADNGCGIDPTHHARVFESFEQASVETHAEFGGTGLGLAITRHLVRLHGSDITLDSALGQGAKFSFDLPRSNDDISSDEREVVRVRSTIPPPMSVPAVAEVTASPSPSTHIVSGRTALLVDDDVVNLQVLRNYLEVEGYTTHLVTDGPQALSLLSDGLSPDIVLLDVMMPKMSGYEVCRRIRERYSASQLPVLLLTAKSRVNDLQLGFAAGANDYLVKPFSRDELSARMNTHLQLSKINIAYERFVPVEFIKVLGRPSIIDIELGDCKEQHMAVMFADIRLYTTMAEKMAPLENFRFLSEYFKRIGPIVQENSGILSQYLGDGMLALFPRHADDAMQAAVTIQKELGRYNTERVTAGEVPIRTGIGLHSGDLVLGIIGDRYRRSGNVVSDTVNLASRIEGLTGLYGVQIAVSTEFFQELSEPSVYPYRELDVVRVKGKENPVTVWEVFAGDPPRVIETKLATKSMFERGVAAFRSGHLEEARELLGATVRVNPEDLPAAKFLTRIDELQLQTRATPSDGHDRGDTRSSVAVRA